MGLGCQINQSSRRRTSEPSSVSGLLPIPAHPFFAAGAFVRLSPDYRQVGMGQHRQSAPCCDTGVVCRQRPSHYRTLHCFRPAFHCLSHSAALLSAKCLLPSPEPPGRFSIIAPVEPRLGRPRGLPQGGNSVLPVWGPENAPSRRRWPPRRLSANPPTPRSVEQISGEKLLTVGPLCLWMTHRYVGFRVKATSRACAQSNGLGGVYGCQLRARIAQLYSRTVLCQAGDFSPASRVGV